MRCCVALVALVVSGACSKAPEPPKAAPTGPVNATTEVAPAGSGSDVGCERLPFAESTLVPEASGAAWMEIDGSVMLVVVGDSGHDGAFGLVDPETGATRVQGQLPLGAGNAGDDLEGLAARGERLYGLTSNGFMREWTWKDGAFALVAGPYPLGGIEMMCKRRKSNCGLNFEGLAISAAPIGACVGYACSKETGKIFCLREEQGQLVVRDEGIPIIDNKDVLADCAFGDGQALFVGNNLFGLAHTFRVENLADPEHVKITDLGPLGTGFPETVAVRGDTVYRMSDMGGDGPSLMLKFRCPAAGR